MLANDPTVCVSAPHSLHSLSLLRDQFGGHIWGGQMLEVDWKMRGKGSQRLPSAVAATMEVNITRTHGRELRRPGDTTAPSCPSPLPSYPPCSHTTCCRCAQKALKHSNVLIKNQYDVNSFFRTHFLLFSFFFKKHASIWKQLSQVDKWKT